MKILFIRPPRYMWPFHSENSSFWQPLAFASMAAVLRENIDGSDVKILDCCVEKLGWKSTEKTIERERPDVLCLGDETVSASESLRLVRFAKEDNPDVKIVVGGVYFGNMIKDSLLNHPVDFIVRGEGEITFLELIKEMKKNNPNFKKVKGIAFKIGGRAAKTPDRPLIENLDILPMPAYDLLPMDLYGKNAKTHKDFVALEHSRGCISRCNFCVLWKQMGKINSGKTEPRYRTKSVKKTTEEVLHFYEKYKRKTFCWVDPIWNVNAKWNEQFADSMLEHGIEVDHAIWARADFIVRDEQKGILSKQIKAGLNQFMIGLERANNEELRYLDKIGATYETTKKAFEVLRQYPSVLSIATYIYGLPWETKQTMKAFYDNMGSIPFDMGIPLPLNPHPGTKFYDELKEEGLLEIEDFNYFNFVNVVARSRHISRNSLLFNMLLNELRTRTKNEQFASRGITSKRRKGAVKSLAKTKAKMVFRFLGSIASDALIGRPVNLSTKPRWYDN